MQVVQFVSTGKTRVQLTLCRLIYAGGCAQVWTKTDCSWDDQQNQKDVRSPTL